MNIGFHGGFVKDSQVKYFSLLFFNLSLTEAEILLNHILYFMAPCHHVIILLTVISAKNRTCH